MDKHLDNERSDPSTDEGDQRERRKPWSPPELTHYGDMSSLTRIGTSGGPEDFIYGGGPPS